MPLGSPSTVVTRQFIRLPVTLRTTNKAGGGRAAAGERQRASDVCTQQIHQYLKYSIPGTYSSIQHMFQFVSLLCTTNTSGGGRATAGERCIHTAIQLMYLVLLCCRCCYCRRCMSIFLSLPISVGIAGAPPWAVSAPDLAVGMWAWVQTRENRRSPAARTRARRGASESVWVSRCF